MSPKTYFEKHGKIYGVSYKNDWYDISTYTREYITKTNYDKLNRWLNS